MTSTITKSTVEGLATAACLVVSTSLVTAQVRVGPAVQTDTGRGSQPCNETTISAAYSNPLEIVSGWNDYREGSPRTGVGISMDGGDNWTDFLLRPASQHQSSTEGDPMTCFDHRTGTLWAGGMSFFAAQGGIFVARKDPGSATFGPVVMATISSGVDKGWMAAGVDPFDPDASIVYCAYNQGLIRSLDMGDTWTSPQPIDSGLGFNPKTGPNGELYIAYWDIGTRMRLRRSFDGGASMTTAVTIADRMDVWGVDSTRVPGNARVVSLAGLAVDPNSGDLYAVYPDTTSIESNGFNLDIYFSKSTDQGSTWSSPVVINTDAALPGDQFFPWIEVDQQGRIHMVFHDSRGVAQNDTDSVGFFDTYYSYSDDGGASWAEIKITPAPLNTNLAFSGGIFIGDYLGLSTAGRRTLPLYVDTVNGNADVFTNVITDGPSTDICFGIQCPCGNDDPDAGCGNFGSDGSTATGSLLTSSGSDSVSADDLVLSFNGVTPGLAAILFAGNSPIALPFGDGRRCVAGGIRRFPVRTADGSGTVTYGPSEIVGLDNVSVGSTRVYQGWYRDPMGPCGSAFNTSSALQVVWQ